jgi:hypothetical protein
MLDNAHPILYIILGLFIMFIGVPALLNILEKLLRNRRYDFYLLNKEKFRLMSGQTVSYQGKPYIVSIPNGFMNFIVRSNHRIKHDEYNHRNEFSEFAELTSLEQSDGLYKSILIDLRKLVKLELLSNPEEYQIHPSNKHLLIFQGMQFYEYKHSESLIRVDIGKTSLALPNCSQLPTRGDKSGCNTTININELYSKYLYDKNGTKYRLSKLT